MQVAPKNKVLSLLGIRPTGDLGPLTGYTSKRGKPVWYLKAPPKEPPTGYQTHQRNVFRSIAKSWNALTAAQRAAWLAAGRLARLNITGHNLFVWFSITQHVPTIRTVERHSGITLLP